ncbi:MAG: peptidylprolyl isomerase [Gammaproteobacteria bacterium]|nr:peptidylprolyl isomerase [Gammaproteobacteria bacterium]MYH46379.1 peptidylprolyl isomerase [Gammaproteobacteria bacterium]MYL14404.1 peptidylprolyl isomerase [Gammaproteobacteria bacterium]
MENMNMWIRTISLPIMMMSLAAASACSPEPDAAENSPPAGEQEETVLVVFETAAGDIEVALFPDRASLSVAQFLAHVDAGNYDGASFYRVTRGSDGSLIDVVQGGLLSQAVRDGSEAYAEGYPSATAVAHETTDQTGIPNERGTLAFARLDPGTADTEIFFNVRDNPELDTGFTEGGRDGFGYATFGRVVEGMQVLDEVQQMPSDAPTPMETVRGQILDQPVLIRRIYRKGP